MTNIAEENRVDLFFLGQYGYLITEQEKYLSKNQMMRVIEKYN